MTGETQAPGFSMLGGDDAVVCEGDSCFVLEPSAEEAAAASARAVNAAIDEGASL